MLAEDVVVRFAVDVFRVDEQTVDVENAGANRRGFSPRLTRDRRCRHCLSARLSQLPRPLSDTVSRVGTSVRTDSARRDALREG